MPRRDYAGGAAATTLAGSITASSLTINLTASTGWPSGGNGPFFVVINRGEPAEEKILVTSRSGTTLTVASISDRGVDGTAASSHNPGEAVEHCFTAIDADEANAHINNTGLDHHTQYLNNARHDIAARHTFGAALGTPGAPAAIGTTPAAGTGSVPARVDHVHEIGAGAIDSSAMFAAGIVDAAAIGADAVGSSELANDAVDTAAIQNLAVTLGKMASASVDQSKMVSGLRVPVVCTSGTRPGSPAEGDQIYETDTDQIRIWDGSTWKLIGGPGVPQVELTHSVATAIANSVYVTLPMDTEVTDVGAMHGSPNSRITFSEPGRYMYGAYIGWEVNGTNHRQAAVRLNGTTFILAEVTPAASAYGSEVTLCGVRRFVATDFIELQATQNSGVSLNVNSANEGPRFWAQWIAP